MEKYFNTEGRCRQEIHYMVNLDDRLDRMKRLFVDRGKYFVINRGRQYGKTTTLMALAEYIANDYVVLSLDFQMLSSANFADEVSFVISFIEYLEDLLSAKEELRKSLDAEACQELHALKNGGRVSMAGLFRGLSRICGTAEKPVVLMIDEVDSATNYHVFLDFLAMLRGYFLNRENRPAFHSVILAGVYDIKNLKLKLRPDEEHQYNSPWNIAAEFDIEMSFSNVQIAAMLTEYETDHKTGMNVSEVADEIYQYTSGYPYLTSLICKMLDEKLSGNEEILGMDSVWCREGLTEAVKLILKSSVPLFDSMVKQLDAFQDLRDMIEKILYHGKKIPFSPDARSIGIGSMFGFLKEVDGQVMIANRIFEMRMLNMLIAEESIRDRMFLYGEENKSQFIKDHRLDMKLVLEKFVVHFADIYGDNDEKFVEEQGRKFFLLYLKPIINGVGNYYLESQTRDARRTDVIVDYLGERYVIELKIWHGNEYNEKGRQQLIDYLDYYHQERGYLLSFNFNKKKERGVKELQIGSKVIIEAVV